MESAAMIDMSWELIVTVVMSGFALFVALINIIFSLWRELDNSRQTRRSARVARKILKRSQNVFVSFDLIKQYIHGLDDNELRRLLLRSGAICVKDASANECWGLYDRLTRDQQRAMPTEGIGPVNVHNQGAK